MVILTILGGLVLSTILNGYVLSILWKWFIVTIFNLPTLSIISAMGVSLVIRYLTGNMDISTDEEEALTSIITNLLISIIRPFIALLFGYIIYSFMK
jgi:hypothetical protein